MWRKTLNLYALTLTAIVLLIAGFLYPANVSAQTDTDDLTQLIQCSLYAGSNGVLQGCPAYSSQATTSNSVIVPSTPVSVPYNTSTSTNSYATTYAATNGSYVALGDSVAAGLGLAPIPNATAQDTLCGRSPQAYPYLVAQRLSMPLVSYACSGASAGDLLTQQNINGQNLASQLDMAYAQGTPSLITITAGANDINWDYFLRYCYAYNCDTPASTALLNSYLNALNYRLYYALSSIAQRSGGVTPKVVLTGYYNPISSRCTSLQSQLTSSEINWLNKASGALNQTIVNVHSRFNFSRYAMVSFSGYDICSQNPWVQGLSDPAPFHPTAYGQQKIADQVISAAAH
jgi:lysophospholipase L1-like esterase